MYSNKLLIANPKVIKDPIFSKSVVFLTHHDSSKAEGFIINSSKVCGEMVFGALNQNDADGLKKMSEMSRSASLEESDIDSILNHLKENVTNQKIYEGGPCRSGIYMIHGYKELQDEDEPTYDVGHNYEDINYDDDQSHKTRPIVDGVYFGDPAVFLKIVMGGLLSENKFKIMIGHSSWGPGQLENEIAHDAWRVCDPDSSLFFDNKALEDVVESINNPISITDKEFDELFN